ncbi:DNA alkylation repair protein [Listeria costaricensis]|uniref:DNA alkylation repair protein n=1 Tax=Listeria costaricensis TaxID=2026604 RepID=UPI000C08855F|nr:DNA alkylation repair protein [Listeria costaricensis]
MSDLLTIWTTRYRNNAVPEQRPAMEAYMKNRFPFLGIRAGERKALMKELLNELGEPEDLFAFAKRLYQEPEREFHQLAVDLLIRKKKQADVQALSAYEWLLQTNSWWDTVDPIASHLVGSYLERFPEKRDPAVQKWLASGNIWLIRTALLFQLKYKEKTDEQLLFRVINEERQSKEFFIQKAIGWSLREYAKTAPDAVYHFVDQIELAPLSRREALKHFKND